MPTELPWSIARLLLPYLTEPAAWPVPTALGICSAISAATLLSTSAT